MDKYSFSLANYNDINEIIKLYQSLIGTLGCTWNLEYPNEEIVKLDIENNQLYILKDKDYKIISVAMAGVDDELDELEWTPKNPCVLARIGVLLEKQNQGIGNVMLKNLINVIKDKNFDGIIMLVAKQNSSALALYNKNGFKLCGETFMFDIDFYCYELSF